MNAQGFKWGVTQNVCPVCNQPGESIQHLFFDCDEVSRRWTMVHAIVRHSPLQSLVQGNLFLTLKKAFQKQQRCLTQLILVTKIIHITWVERNQVARQGNVFWFLLEHVLRSALLQMKALKDGIHLDKKIAILNHSYAALCDTLNKFHEHNDNQ